MLPNCIEGCNRLLPDPWSGDSATCMGVCAHTRVAQQRLNEECPQMIEKELNGYLITLQIWIWCRHCVCGETQEAILKPLSEAQNNFW